MPSLKDIYVQDGDARQTEALAERQSILEYVVSSILGLGAPVLAVAALAAFIAGMSKAGFGAGIAAAATPLLALVVEPAVALGAMLPVLMVVDVAAVQAHWKRWAWPEARTVILASIPGIAAGAILHAVTHPDVFRVLIGLLSVLFVLYQWMKSRGWVGAGGAVRLRAGYLWGCVAGFTSFVAHAGGPPVLIYLFARNLGKAEFLATTVISFWAINLLKLPPYFALGFYSGGASWLILWLVPFALIGVRFGLWAANRMSDKGFFAMSYFFLILIGIKLIYDGLT